MAIKFNKKQTKKLKGEIAQQKRDIEELKDFQNKVTLIAIWILIIAGSGGTIATVFIDPIRGRTWEWDWLQIIGMGVFMAMFMAGGILLKLLRK